MINAYADRKKRRSIMRKLLPLITLSCVMAIGAGSANAAALTSAVQSLKTPQTSVIDKVCHHRYYGGYGYYRPYGFYRPYYGYRWWG
jgi:hypothetical protein